jgi:ABC-2 type transport system permease protein
MTAMPSASALAAGPGPVAVSPVTQLSVIRSEWIKLRSLRSTIILLALTAALQVAIGLIAASLTDWKTMSAAGRVSFDPIGVSMRGVYFAGFTVSILGVLVITGEYSTGMIRATFGAVPRRIPVLWAKAAVFAAVVFALTLAASFAAFLGTQAILGPHGVSLDAPNALRVVFGSALFLTVMALLGLGLGFLTRSTAGGIAAVIALTFVLPDSGGVVPRRWQPYIVPYLPMQSGQAVFTTSPNPEIMLRPWTGFALFCGYAAIALAAAVFLLRRRDVGTYGGRLRVPRVRLRRRLGTDGSVTVPTAWSPPSSAVLPGAVTVGPVTQAGVIRSEWIKLRSLRSPAIVLALTMVHIMISGLIVASLTVWQNMSAADRANFDPISKSLSGVHFAGFIIIVLGVLVITGEYSAGTIRATLCAVPRRLPVLWAKAAVFAAVVFTLTLAASFAGFLISQVFYGAHGLGVSLAAPGAVRAVFGAALFLTAMGLLGLGIGFLTRSTAGGIATAVAFTFVVQNIRGILPPGWQPSLMPYLPLQAGWAVYMVPPEQYMLHPWRGFAVFCGYAAVAIAAGAFVLRRRDVGAYGGRRRRAAAARRATGATRG